MLLPYCRCESPQSGLSPTSPSKETREHFNTVLSTGHDYTQMDYLDRSLFYKQWAILGLFFVYFCLFKQTLQFLQEINVKNVHLLYDATIRTHNLRT